MPLMKHWYHSWLVPYAEGTLDERQRAKLEARLASDPALAAEAEAVRRTVGRLRSVSQNEHGEAAPIPASPSELWPQIEARLQPARRTEPRPWLWAGGACAAAALAWATLWGPLTPHTAYPVNPGNAVQSIAEKTPSLATPAPGLGSSRHPRKPHGSSKIVKHPGRVHKSTPVSRPEPVDLLASGAAPTSTMDDSHTAADAPQSGPGHLRLTTEVHDLPRKAPDQANQDGTADKPTADQVPPSDDGGAAAKAGESTGNAQEHQAPAPPSRRKRHHRRHRRHHSGEQAAPVQTAPSLPPDTIPRVDTAPPSPKHRPDID